LTHGFVIIKSDADKGNVARRGAPETYVYIYI